MSFVTHDMAMDAIASLLQQAKEKGAEDPALANSSDGSVVILDMDSGKTWRAELKEF